MEVAKVSDFNGKIVVTHNCFHGCKEKGSDVFSTKLLAGGHDVEKIPRGTP